MKFIDVINNMKVGEKYKSVDDKSDIRYITRTENGVEFGLIYNVYRINTIPNDLEFELEKKEYDFTEAFKAFKDGYMIQSVNSKIAYCLSENEVTAVYYDSKTYYLCNDNLFTLNEINGKWYILD